MFVAEVGEGAAMATPMEEQKSTCAGEVKEEESERLMRFWRDASWGLNEATGSAKFTAQAQWIMCVASVRIFWRMGAGRPRSGFERSDAVARILEEGVIWCRLRAWRASPRREIAVCVSEVVRRRQYTLETLGRLISWANMCAPSEPVAPVRISKEC